MTNKLIRISTTGIERVRTTAAKTKNHHQQEDDCSLSEAGTDTTVLIDNTTAARTNHKCPSQTHILQVEMSNVSNILPDYDDTSFEVQFETALVVISHDSLDVDSETDESDEDESAIEVICV